MKRILVAFGLTMLIFTVSVQAQAPKPGPEHQRLSSFLGTWKIELENKDSPISRASKLATARTCSWFEGNFHMICEGTVRSASYNMKFIGIYGWNPDQKNYEYHEVTSDGALNLFRVTLSGDTWTRSWEVSIGGKLYHFRYMTTDVSPTMQSLKRDYSEDGKTWTTFQEGKAVKQ